MFCFKSKIFQNWTSGREKNNSHNSLTTFRFVCRACFSLHGLHEELTKQGIVRKIMTILKHIGIVYWRPPAVNTFPVSHFPVFWSSLFCWEHMLQCWHFSAPYFLIHQCRTRSDSPINGKIINTPLCKGILFWTSVILQQFFIIILSAMKESWKVGHFPCYRSSAGKFL